MRDEGADVAQQLCSICMASAFCSRYSLQDYGRVGFCGAVGHPVPLGLSKEWNCAATYWNLEWNGGAGKGWMEMHVHSRS